MPTLADLYAKLQKDPARDGLNWSEDMLAAQAQLLSATEDGERERILGAWLGRAQPCLFGKMAARGELLEYCFLDQPTLQSDDLVQQAIQSARTRWKKAAMRGEKHGFVILALDEKLAFARPDATLMCFAQRLAELYLLESPIATNQVYTDRLLLKVGGFPDDHLFEWLAGVNVFASAADRRWWQDHRIPGGLAFSVNSVGHMVKSAELRKVLPDLLAQAGITELVGDIGPVDSLSKALNLAMSTIHEASEAVSGKATRLLPKATLNASDPACPAKLFPKVAEFNPCRYVGTYNTDETVPAEYFQEDIQRPKNIDAIELDFTYLFHEAATNPAFVTMGKGLQITGPEGEVIDSVQPRKAAKQWPRELTGDEKARALSELEGG